MRKLCMLLLLSFFSVLGGQDTSSTIADHKEWLEKQYDRDKAYEAFYKEVGPRNCKCSRMPYIRNIKQAMDKLEKSDEDQQQQGCFLFKTWTPVCDDYLVRDWETMKTIMIQLYLCEN